MKHECTKYYTLTKSAQSNIKDEPNQDYVNCIIYDHSMQLIRVSYQDSLNWQTKSNWLLHERADQPLTSYAAQSLPDVGSFSAQLYESVMSPDRFLKQ